MPRPKCRRRVAVEPRCCVFRPETVAAGDAGEIILTLDELEAIRLADLEGFYQEAAAGRMNVSRQTFGRILEEGRRKIARAIVGGKQLRIEGGVVKMIGKRIFVCSECEHVWGVAHGTPRPGVCPACGSANIHRSESDRGPRGGGRGRHGHGHHGQGRGRCGRGHFGRAKCAGTVEVMEEDSGGPGMRGEKTHESEQDAASENAPDED